MRILLNFFVIGLFGFGGGFGMVPLLTSVTLANHWMSRPEIVQAIAAGQVTPGPVAISATFIGYRAAGLWGAVFATVGVFLPSMIVTVGISRVYRRIRGEPWLQPVLRYTMSVVIGLMAAVTISLGQVTLTDWKAALLAALTILAVVRFKVPYWAVVLSSAALGMVLFGH